MNSLHRLFTAKGAGLISRSSYLQMVGCPQLKSRIYDRNPIMSSTCNLGLQGERSLNMHYVTTPRSKSALLIFKSVAALQH